MKLVKIPLKEAMSHYIEVTKTLFSSLNVKSPHLDIGRVVVLHGYRWGGGSTWISAG